MQTISDPDPPAPSGRPLVNRQAMSMAPEPIARFGGVFATELDFVSSELRDLDQGGRWAVAIPYSGQPVLARFGHWEQGQIPERFLGTWGGLDPSSWVSSMDVAQYMAAVESTRARISLGHVYQVNICRVRSSPRQASDDIMALDHLLAQGNPAPYGGALRLPVQNVHIACASPELFLSRSGEVLESGPIKGTAPTPEGISAKDRAENIMIVDLVRNDLSRCAVTGSVKVTDLLEIQDHPGLVQLVSTITARLVSDSGWPQILDATFPPGSVTGAPKSSALQVIEELELQERAFYCGAFGWIDADTHQAQLAVAIRTFWFADDRVKFGTGAGITWNSNAQAEWDETELKARRLSEVASWKYPADE